MLQEDEHELKGVGGAQLVSGLSYLYYEFILHEQVDLVLHPRRPSRAWFLLPGEPLNLRELLHGVHYGVFLDEVT